MGRGDMVSFGDIYMGVMGLMGLMGGMVSIWGISGLMGLMGLMGGGVIFGGLGDEVVAEVG